MLYTTSIKHAFHKPVLIFSGFYCVFIKFYAKFDRATLLKISFLHFRNASQQTTHSLSSQTCWLYRVETCTEHQVGMYVSAGVGDVATILPVLEPSVQSHYFLDTPCMSVTMQGTQLMKWQATNLTVIMEQEVTFLITTPKFKHYSGPNVSIVTILGQSGHFPPSLPLTLILYSPFSFPVFQTGVYSGISYQNSVGMFYWTSLSARLTHWSPYISIP
jgi:hypothetical protein